ncbi:MAG: beta-ketoacyl synthase N-terminal-like domain-containing protein [Cyanobacteria bacterium J06627_28]
MRHAAQNSSQPGVHNPNAQTSSERMLKALKEARSQLEAIEQARSERVAIIGMAGRFPGADNLQEFWQLLEQGKSGIRFLSEEELLAADIPQSTFTQPNYVPAYASFSDPTGFDAQFFGYSPREAELIDPQHRVFLECAWSALEDAGYDSHQYDGRIGVYGGAALNRYLVNLHSNTSIRESTDPVQAVVSNVMGLMPTRVSYQLDLKGPSCGIQTGCSTALVAIHTACQTLLKQECDIALAGGVTVNQAMPQGYLHQPDSIASPDGTCRAFDADGQGTLFGNGVGIIVLKRLRAAIADGDHIYAVIKGSAINNDGADKVNLIAPSVSGQAAVIRDAIARAGIHPNTISYVEGHGTGTPLGDPIEVAALNKAFGNKVFGKASSEDNANFSCALGSVKTNVGHLDAAAGAAGLIKTALSLQHKTLPASLNFHQPNPRIDFQNGPFAVNHTCRPWPVKKDEQGSLIPRRAGVSSFGMGGTNAHAILEEAPERSVSGASRPWQLITLSAKTETALEQATQNLAAYLQSNPDLSMADVAYTLQIGRRAWPCRRYYLCQDVEGAIAQLKTTGTSAVANSQSKSVVFMFSGQGAQYLNMAKGLYETEPVFRNALNKCATFLANDGIDLIGILYPSFSHSPTPPLPHSPTPPALNQTFLAQPALFSLEYALAQLWLSWGIQPHALIGHSVGEYVAACLAGVFSLEDGLTLMVKRGQLMQACEPGAMLSVLDTVDAVQPQLPKGLELAAINGPQNCVISGPSDIITTFQQQLEKQNIPCRQLTTSHAFHSATMESVVDKFLAVLEKVTLSAPNLDILSNVTGTWLTDEEATSAQYWARHLRQIVRFSQGVTTALTLENPVLVEVGPGHTLTKLVQQHLSADSQTPVIQSLPHPKDNRTDTATVMAALGDLWLAGVPVDWMSGYQEQTRHRLSLPTYPFERETYWVPLQTEPVATNSTTVSKKPDMSNWFYLPTWKRLPLTAEAKDCSGDRWLVFADEKLHQQLQASLVNLENRPKLIWISPGEPFSLESVETPPKQIIYGWGLTSQPNSSKNDDFQTFLSVLKAYGSAETAITFSVLTTAAQDVTGRDPINPHNAKILGLCQVVSQEYPGHACRIIDLDSPISDSTVQLLSADLLTPYSAENREVACRQGQRWIKTYEPLALPEKTSSHLKPNSTYLIAGDLVEGLGMVYAQALVKALGAKLILLGRPGLPAREEWEKWLVTHGPQHGISQLIRKLQALGREGEQFLWFSGDLANEDWVEESIQQGIAKFGEITGVFHAGVMGDRASCTIEQLTKAESDRISKNKIQGIQSVQRALANHPVEFYLLQSSLSTVVGGIGFGAYAAANCYLDTLANQQNRLSPSSSTRWLSLNWDACQIDDTADSSHSDFMALAMTKEEVWQATRRVIAQANLSQVIISPRDLQSRRLEAFTPKEKSQDQISSTTTPSNQRTHHKRPKLTTAYVAPRSPIEQRVAKEMGDLLGIDAIGVEDNFFELGGHSLLAIQAVTRLRQDFQVDLPMRAFLFEAPTAAGIAKIIEEQVSIPPDTQATLESLLDNIEAMSPEEVKNEI